MALRAGLGTTALVTLLVLSGLVLSGCGSTGSTASKCPKPVDYDEATLKKISEALRALPADNVLRQAMEDYENERDDLRFCP